MKRLLLAKQDLMAGHDFLVASMHEHCNLSLLLKRDERYSLPSARPELVVSINPLECCDADFLQAVFNSAPVVVQLHNQLEYLDDERRNNAIRSLSFVRKLHSRAV
jgi:hypothetical protein